MDDDGKPGCAQDIFSRHLERAWEWPTNIFPQDAAMNRGVYAQFEGKIYDCIASSGCESGYLAEITYADSTRTKPDQVHFPATFKGGDCDYSNRTSTTPAATNSS